MERRGYGGRVRLIRRRGEEIGAESRMVKNERGTRRKSFGFLLVRGEKAQPCSCGGTGEEAAREKGVTEGKKNGSQRGVPGNEFETIRLRASSDCLGKEGRGEKEMIKVGVFV